MVYNVPSRKLLAMKALNEKHKLKKKTWLDVQISDNLNRRDFFFLSECQNYSIPQNSA